MTAYKSVFLSTFLQGSESLVCQEKDKGKLNDVTTGYLRSVCGKTRRERVKNTWVMNECEYNFLLRWLRKVNE